MSLFAKLKGATVQSQPSDTNGKTNAVAPVGGGAGRGGDGDSLEVETYDVGPWTASMPLAFDPHWHGPSGVLRKFFDGHYVVLMGLVSAAIICLGVWAVPAANINYLFYGSDRGERLCGVDVGVKAAKYLVFADANITDYRFCAPACPQRGDFLCYDVDGSLIISAPANGTSLNVTTLPAGSCRGGNFTVLFDTSPIYNRCMPTSREEELDAWNALAVEVDVVGVMVGQLYGDVYTARYVIVGGFFLAVMLSYMLTQLLEGMVKVYTGLAVIAGTGAPLYLGVQVAVLGKLEVDQRMKTMEQLLNLAEFGGLLMMGFSALLAIYLAVKRKRIKLAIQLFNETYVAVRRVPGLSSVPLIAVGCLTPVVGLALVVALFLLALSRERAEAGNASSGFLGWMGLFHVLAVYWFLGFLVGVVRVTTAGAIGEWYWTREPREHKLRDKPLRTSARRALRYHSGSIAMGALMFPYLAPFKLVASLLPKDSPTLTQSWWLYFNDDAYVQVAQHGAPLLESARRAAHLLRRNERRVGSSIGVTSLLLLQGELAVAGLCGVVATIAIDVMGLGKEVTTPVGPVLCVIAAALATSSVYFSVYNEAVETILQCFCEDCERNDGSMMRAYFMPDSLKKFIIVSSGGEVEHTLRANVGGAGKEDHDDPEEEEGGAKPWWRRPPRDILRNGFKIGSKGGDEAGGDEETQETGLETEKKKGRFGMFR